MVLSEEALIEAIGELRIGSCYPGIASDDTEQVIEACTEEILTDHEPPPGMAHSTLEELLQLVAATRYLL